jgi:hypothetical protein
MGRHFWVGRGCFFLGGRGRGRGAPGCVLLRSFRRTSGLQTDLLVSILYVEQWRFRCSMSSDHRERGSSILGRPGQTCEMSRASTTRRPVHTLTTVEGLRPSFRHGLHGAVGMIFYTHVVYVVICYMSIICYMPVICLAQSPPQEEVVVFGYIEGPFLVSRTGCARERHPPCIEGPFLVNRTGHANERHAPYRCMSTSTWDMSTSIWDTKLQTGGVEG